MPFHGLPARLSEIRDRIEAARARGGHGQDVRIVAVTKTHGPEAVDAAVACGLGDVGENKVQEALDKMAAVTVPVRWHLIGHLQRNKAKAATRFALVHGLDSVRLADALARAAADAGTVLDVLVQVNVSGEESKSGIGLAEVAPLAAHLATLPALRVRGAMTMAPYDAPEGVLRRCFAGARAARATLVAEGHEHADALSMGMSGDYEIAVEEGATLVRLGTILFGTRGE
jgi:pyridoxal phosphate enzyme (YggS family)